MKNTGKLTLLMIAVVALGIFALPSVMSIGTGQHTFNNGTDVQCSKCHALTGDKVAAELSLSGTAEYVFNTKTPDGTGRQIHKQDGVGAAGECSGCHRMAGMGSVGEHTAITRQPFCASCHTIVLDVLANTGELTGENEPHNGFAASTLTDRNAGCLGCHTAVTVSGASPSYSYSGATTALGLTIGNATLPYGP